MMRFAYRNARLALVASAIKAIGGPLKGKAALAPRQGKFAYSDFNGVLRRRLLADLQKEQQELRTDRYEVCDVFVSMLMADWTWDKTSGMREAAGKDPALRALDLAPSLTEGTAAELQALPRSSATRHDLLRMVRERAGEDAEIELAGIALGAWLREGERSNPVRDVAVLLPLRLETLFKSEDRSQWRLLVRATPDEPSIQRHGPQVSQIEADCLVAFWKRSHSLEIVPSTIAAEWLAGEAQGEGAIAWTELCDQVGAARAAFLVAAFPPVLLDGAFVCTVPDERIGNNPPPHVAGLPPELAITAFDFDGQRLDVGFLIPKNSDIPLVMPGEEEAGPNWLTDWQAAKAVGLGEEFWLPPGWGPERIAALYVYGVGDEPANELFCGHANAGVMGLLQPGAATNSIEGGEAADLGKDPVAWRRVAVNRMCDLRGSGTQATARALCGSGEAVADIPGGNTFTGRSRELVQALWPALWGHWMRDVWGRMDEAHDMWNWANHWVAPEGPLAPLRIDTQPYGLLPVMVLEGWQPAGDTFDAAEERLVRSLVLLIQQRAHAAEHSAAVSGADETDLLDRLARTGVSADYDYRTFVPAEILAPILAPGAQAQFNEVAASLWRPAADVVGGDPTRDYLAVWDAQRLTLPLIGAQRMLPMSLKDFFHKLYTLESEMFGEHLFGEGKRTIVPDSLLIRLMVWSAMAAKAWYMQSHQSPAETLVNPVWWDDPDEWTPLARGQMGFDWAVQNGLGEKPAAELVLAHRDHVMNLASRLSEFQREDDDPYHPGETVGVLDMPENEHADLDRALRATLDTASHRLDPWATGIAWHRLNSQLESGRAHHRLGAYGWLDGPFIGQPGPNGSGRLHAPSYTQALASIVMRDKQLQAEGEKGADGKNIWRTQLDSACVRTALEIAQEIRLDFHLYEVVGRRVEEIVAGRDRIARLRALKPLRPERPDPRDVCQGMEALEGLLAGNLAGVLSDDDFVRDTQRQRLVALDEGLKAFADLLLVEGVFSVVAGHPELAADAMDAAAGFARPPSFDAVKTPPSGYRLVTSTVSVIQYRPAATDGAPIEIADASLAAFLSERFGDASLWVIRARWKDGGGDAEGDVTIAELGLTPLQAVLIPEDFLAEAARARLGKPDATVAQLDGHRLMRQAIGMLAAQPAVATDISAVPDSPADAEVDLEISQELARRYLGVHAACSVLAEGVAENDPVKVVSYLRQALAWGVVGPAEPTLRHALIGAAFDEVIPAHDALASLLNAARATFIARINQAPDPATLEGVPATVLARAISELLLPGGRIAVTACWPVATLRERSGLRAEPETALDTDWLSVIAAVRPSLARLEAVQLEAWAMKRFEPLAAWTAAPPGDPWRTKLIADNQRARAEDLASLSMSRLVHAFGAADAFGGSHVAVGLVDQFSEAVPMPQRSTYAAFGFNAPAARAPQAIILGVPAKPDHRMQPQDILETVIETRRLAHARAARPQDGAPNPIESSLWLQASGPLRVMLDGTQYTR
ncbi:hypothetical protein [Mesorhizobium sp. CAU 1741]|uniref:hypothetical protein n=1 Tax=Mesorhizobium sp. CAU 1741 TaxID=3140366 RepID=UPI00325BA687